MKKILTLLFFYIAIHFCLKNSASAQATARINHIAFYVVDLKTSTNFYLNIIGLDTIPEPFHDGHHTWFLIGPKAHLHIISGAKEKTFKDKNSHLCFSVPSVPDFVEVLKKNNIPFESWTGKKIPGLTG